jgi:sugar lactone lactonase YvrE
VGPCGPGGCEPELIVAFDPEAFELPESIAVDADGNLYVSIQNRVVKLDENRAASTLLTLPGQPGEVFATGVKFGPDGMLYVGSGSFDPTTNAAAVWRASPDTGALELVATLEPDGFPNDLAFEPDGTIYVTDSFRGSVWRIDPEGTALEWLVDEALAGDPAGPALGGPFGADGIAFDRTHRVLYLTNLDRGTILSVRVRGNGDPGTLQVVAEDELLVGADGIAFDVRGTLYVAVNAQDRIATVDRFGAVSVVLEGAPLDGPSSFAFGASPGDGRTLYFTNFAITRASAGEVANPGVLSLDVLRPGLRLP